MKRFLGFVGGGTTGPLVVAVVLGLFPCVGVAWAESTCSRSDGLWGTDGTVTAVVRSGNTIYVGGSFDRVGPCTGSGIPLDWRSGAVPPTFAKVLGTVYAVVPDAAGGWYIGGTFSGVGGVARHNLAHVLADGRVAPWAPEPDGIVWALALHDGVVYVGGGFGSIGGQARNLIAAVDGRSGTVMSWNARADVANPQYYGPVVLAIAVAGQTIYLGGIFSQMNGQPRSNVAALDARTARPTSWNPGVGGAVNAIAVGERAVYVGGDFWSVGDLLRSGLAAIDPATGVATAWDLQLVRPDFPWFTTPPMVSTLVLRGSTLFAAGCFEAINGQIRHGLAAIEAADGSLLPWAPNPDGGTPYTYLNALVVSHDVVYVGGEFASLAGANRNKLGAVDIRSGVATPWDPRPNTEVRALAASGAQVYAGGYFTSAGGWQMRHCLAALDATTGVLKPWDAHLNGYGVQALAIQGSVLYIGGDLSVPGARPRSNLAALDLETAAPLDWSPDVDGPVWTLAATDSVLYAGGAFMHAGGEERHRIAAIRLTDGSATPWDPQADDAVATIALGRNTVYAGGLFGQIGRQVRSRIGALDPTTGAATNWDPAAHSWGWVNSLAISDGTVYVGGLFISIGGAMRNNLAAVDAATGVAAAWNPNPDGEVEAVTVSGGTVIAGGFFREVAGQERRGLVAVGLLTGTALDWNPIPDANIWTIASYAGALYVGGDFSSVGYVPQLNVASVPLPLGVASPLPGSVAAHAPLVLLGTVAPNPVRLTASLSFELFTPTAVRLTFFDLQGRQVAVEADQTLHSAGLYETRVPVGDWPTGAYFCRLEGAGQAVSRKFLVIH